MKKLFAVMILAIALSAGCVYAESEEVTFNGHTYQRIDIETSWTSAKSYCENIGGHLATVTSQQEDDFIYSVLVKPGKNNAWLGASDEAREGDWKWVTGEMWTYKNWDTNQPDNYLGAEHYLHMYHSTYPIALYPSTWNDTLIDGRNAIGSFICEWDTDTSCNADESAATLYQTGLIHVPVIEYSTLFGTVVYWGDFQYVPTNDGKIMFELKSYGIVE